MEVYDEVYVDIVDTDENAPPTEKRRIEYQEIHRFFDEVKFDEWVKKRTLFYKNILQSRIFL
jgi:hypothetical protein